METFESEFWNCPDCGPKCDYAKVKDWKYTNCGDPIWIATQINGKKYALERIKAKEIQKDDVILLDGMDHGDDMP